MPVPASVPPVPTAATKPSTLPSVCRQISGPVVSICASRLATLSNWLAQTAPFGSVFAERLGEAAGDLHIVVRVGIGDGRDLHQRGAGEPQHVLLFLALRVGDDDHRAEAERVADQSEADAGIAGGALDDDAAGAQLAAGHRVLDDVERGAVLHRLAGIEELRLAENGAAGGFRGTLELDERRVADRLDQIVPDVHDFRILLPCLEGPRN